MGDDPPFLSVGTEVSAKYKGAFCEAKVRKVVKIIKCKVLFKLGLGSAVLSDDHIKGLLRVGAQVEARHPEKGYVEAVINKIQDCSQYTVVFDDGDITTLRRTSLCLKSGRHFAESETLDQLPLTHPEHFGTPVLGGRRGGRKRDDSSDDEDAASESSQQDQSGSSRKQEEKEPNIGKVVCVEVSEKKKGKESWFPGLIVAPTAQDAVPIRVKDEYLVRSFKDGRYYTVPKKEATEFTREVAQKTELSALKAAIEKALLYLDRDELPPHWDREVLFGLDDASSVNESKGGTDGESSDDETREEKDHFVAQLYKFMDDNGTPINKGPTINSRDLDLYRLFKIVNRMGGFNRVTNQNGWKTVTEKMVLNSASNSVSLVKQAYKKYLYGFEDFYRKLGCTMNSPRSVKSRAVRPGRSLIRDKDKATSGASTPKMEPEEEEEKVKPEETAEPAKATVEDAPASVDGNESEGPTTVLQTPARKQRERSLPARLLDSITPKSTVKKEEDSGGDDANDQDNESNSNQSMRSQRTRTRIPRNEESDQQDSARTARKRGKSRGEDKSNDDDDKTSRTKSKDDEGKDEDKKIKKEDERKSKTPGKHRNKKNEDIKVEDVKKGDDDNGSVDVEEPIPKRRGRKPRAVAESDDDDNGKLPPNVDVQIGDKLKVYYCPMQDSKVTYEAKVCEIRSEGTKKLYLVHYTGWNTRYDEWIKRSRIAENLTWTPNRKRSKSAHNQEKARSSIPSQGGKTTAKRGRARGQDSSRSATPSSVTSTSSTGQRNVNASGEDGGRRPPSKGNRRRSRRISEMSAASAESSESSDGDDEEEEVARVRKKSGKKAGESEESEPVDADEADQTPQRRVHHRRKISETDSNSVDTKPDACAEGATPSTPVRRGRRRAITAPESTLPEVGEVKKEPEDEEKILNYIPNDLSLTTGVSNGAETLIDVSEAKFSPDLSVASNVKTTSIVPPPSQQTQEISNSVHNAALSTELVTSAYASIVENGTPESAQTASVASPPDSAANANAYSSLPDASTATPLVVPSVVVFATSPAQAPESQKMGSRGGNDDDVYEFREPEPFAFEARPRRESPFSEDRVTNRLTPRKATNEEDDENNKKSTNLSSNERNKSVITLPPNRPTAENPELQSSDPLSVSPLSPKANLEVIKDAGSGRTSPKRSLSPQHGQLKPAQEPPKEPVKTAVAVPVISANIIQAPNITQVLPALSALAARSMPARVSPIIPPQSITTEVEPDFVNTAEKEHNCNDPENKIPQGVEEKSNSKRRKVSNKKVVSQEFVESDEDSPNDATDDGPSKVVKDEIVEAPSALEEESGPNSNVQEDLLTPTKIKENPNSTKTKTDEDLDENSLLCEETIPGSPVTHCSAPSSDNTDASVVPVPSTSRSTEMPFASAPSAPNLPRTRGLHSGPNSAGRANRKRSLRETLAMQRPGMRPGAGSLMMENTPPTTPDGSLSSSSNSPQGDHYGGMSPEHESSVKSEREQSESDNQASQGAQSLGPVSVVRNVGPRATATAQPVTAPMIKRKDEEPQRQPPQEDESPIKRRRRVNAAPEPSSGKKGRGHGRSPRRTGSDSEDTAAEYVNSSNAGSTLVSMSGYIPRSTRYNFCTDLDPDMDASQRIAFLQEKLRELRQTYSALKARVVMIDRRRKKLKRKEKESSS